MAFLVVSLTPNADFWTAGVAYIVPFVFRISQHLQRSESGAVFMDKAASHCALPRSGSSSRFVELRCWSELEIVPCFCPFQKSSLGKILKSFPALSENSWRCLWSPHRHVGISATRIPSHHSLAFARRRCRRDTHHGDRQMDPRISLHVAATFLLAAQAHSACRLRALCSASLHPALRGLWATSPLPLPAAPQNRSGSGALKYQ